MANSSPEETPEQIALSVYKQAVEKLGKLGYIITAKPEYVGTNHGSYELVCKVGLAKK